MMIEFTTNVSRRTVLAGLAALASRPAFAQVAPLRIGFLTVKTGPLAAPGKQMEEGFQLFLRERGFQIAGRKVELIVADTTGDPAVAKTKTQELIERQKVHVLVGPLASYEALAIDESVRAGQTPVISSSAAAEDLTQRKANEYFLRSASSSAQFSHPFGVYSAKELGYRRIVTIGDDLAYSHEGIAGFQRTFEESGGKIVQRLWSPLNTPDYASYIAQIDASADALFAVFAGVSASRFLQQARDYGLREKLPLLGGMTTVDEALLATMGDEAIGVISAAWYSAAIDTPENKAFVEAYRKTQKADPGIYTTGAYCAGLVLEAALQALNGRVEDKPAFLKALHAVNIARSPRGAIHFDPYGNPIGNIYIRKTERRDGRLMNSVLKVYPDVSQFWTYDPKEFLAAPVYGRNYVVRPASK
jgi:branched-chain amino acid transport system substrate-binding protein